MRVEQARDQELAGQVLGLSTRGQGILRAIDPDFRDLVVSNHHPRVLDASAETVALALAVHLELVAARAVAVSFRSR
mgnify:CR=1 FL=1